MAHAEVSTKHVGDAQDCGQSPTILGGLHWVHAGKPICYAIVLARDVLDLEIETLHQDSPAHHDGRL